MNPPHATRSRPGKSPALTLAAVLTLLGGITPAAPVALADDPASVTSTTAPAGANTPPQTNAPPASPVTPTPLPPALLEKLGQLKTSYHDARDPGVAPLGADLGRKTYALAQALAAAAASTSTTALEDMLQAILGTDADDALQRLLKLPAPGMGPIEANLAKDVRDAGCAYLVQRNLGTLEGSRNDVAQLVLALRQGRAADVLPSAQRLLQNSRLTPAQKDFLEAFTRRWTKPASPAPARP